MVRDLALALVAAGAITLVNATLVPGATWLLQLPEGTLDPLTLSILADIPIKLLHETLWVSLATWLSARRWVALTVTVALAFLLQFVPFTPEGAEPSPFPWFMDYAVFVTPLLAGLTVLLLARFVERAKETGGVGA